MSSQNKRKPKDGHKFGEFEKKRQESISQQLTRAKFLGRLTAIAPKTVAELRDNLFPIFNKLQAPFLDDKQERFLLGWAYIEEIQLLREGLLDWSKKRNLDADWVRAAVINAMQLWMFDKKAAENLWLGDDAEFDTEIWDLANEDLKAVSPPAPPEGLPLWNPFYTSREKYLQEVESEAKDLFKGPLLSAAETSRRNDLVGSIKEKAKDYCKKVEDYLHSLQDFKQISIRPELDKHLRWTVEFQVLEREYRDIAKEYKETAANVSVQVKRTLGLLDLKPRQNIRRGRPRQDQ